MKIRKALLSCVLVLAVALVCFFALPIDAEAATSGDYTYTVSNGKATITVCSTSISGDVTIPSTLGGYPVTAIGDRAFSGCTGLTSVTIPDSFTSINDYAFSDCTELESVNLPNGITSIGMRAFSNCKKLTEIYIPSSILSIGNSPFFNCTSIVGIWVDENNANYSSDAQGILYNKDKTVLIQAPGTITSCVIPAGVKEIDSYAFYRCYLLADITVPDGVIKIDAYAFKNCTSLTSIIIPDGVERIGQESFMFCTSLVSVTIPQSVSYVGYEAFYFCSNIREVYITNIGAWCNIYFGDSVANPLYYAEHLYINGEEESDISIPEGVQAITSYAFYNCQQLKSIAIPEGVTTIGSFAFKNCTSLTSIAIPSSTTALLEQSFRNCNNLTTVYLSKNTTTIDELTFDACPISDVYFNGTKLDRNNISIGAHNTALTDATWHCNTCETHIYDNTCDDSCNQCGWIRIGAGHIYSTGCDADCDRCGYIREATHQYTLNEKHTCSFCKHSKTPVAPTLANCTENSITLTAHDGFEYSKDGETWQASNLFNNLTKGTEYTFYQRIKETESAFASEISPAFIAKTLTAYTVSYNANGGTSAPANQTKKSNTDLILSNTKPTYSGHTFLGWSTTPYGEIEYKCGDRYSQNCDLVLYAKWGKTHSACEGMGYTVTERSWTETCATCSGYGFVDGTGFGCLRCKGTSMTVWNGMMQCTTCKDATYIYKNADPCTSCGRKGYHTRVEKTEYPCYGCNQEGYLLIENVPIAAPTLLQVGNTYVELVPVDGVEYSKDGINWQSNNVFNNLNLTTTYRFYQRYAANGINLAGPSSEALCITIQQELMRTLVCKNYDNTIYLTDTYQNGDDIPFPTRNPIKPSDEAYIYTFEKWELVESESSEKCKVYIAIFKSAPIDYTVIFQDYDGREISKKTDYHYGDTVVPPADPTKAADNTYTYVFAGWDKEVLACAGDATYTATYVSTYIDYTVVFQNWNGDVLSTKSYHYGDKLTAPADPTKVADKAYCYTFAGWDQMADICIGNTTYTATYQASPHDCTNATCTEPATCKACGITTGEALGHDYADATCAEPATCKVCGATTGEALGHDYADATCTDAKTCKVCGDIDGDPLGHKYGSGAVTTKATCKATGVKTFACSACGGKKTETIAKLTTHTYSNACDTKCNVCGKTRTVPAHKYSHACDTTCNVCSVKRSITHKYTNSCDTTCNACGAKRSITHKYKTTTTKATLKKNGSVVKKCTVCDKVASNVAIKYAKTFKLSATTYTYNGKVKTPTVTVKDSAGKTLKKNTDYTVKYASGRENVGTYKVTITFKGKYSGTKVLTFKILPKAASVNKLTAKTKALSVKLNKQTTQTSGYQIQYATSKTFKSYKTATITSNKTTTKTISGLKAKTTYYVRVRTYKTVGGVKIYSNWSTAKNVKTK